MELTHISCLLSSLGYQYLLLLINNNSRYAIIHSGEYLLVCSAITCGRERLRFRSYFHLRPLHSSTQYISRGFRHPVLTIMPIIDQIVDSSRAVCMLLFNLLFHAIYFLRASSSSLLFIVVTQIRGHIAGSSPPSPLHYVPCFYIARRVQPFSTWCS